MKLTILVPTLVTRRHLFERLYQQLDVPCRQFDVPILAKEDMGEKSIGAKRNELLDACKSEYCVFIDDDDTVASNYLHEIFKGIEMGVDVIGFKGIITNDGRKPEEFIHKLGMKWETARVAPGKNLYKRPPNHLNPMKTEIARQIRFPETSHGEDKDFAERLAEAGLLKTEYFIDGFMYYYQYRSKK